MEASGGPIKLRKELNDLDKLVLDFVRILDKNKVNYVLVSGYVSILFGRSRSSEDIDLIAERISRDRFSILWKEIKGKFRCITTSNLDDAYENYLAARSTLRFYRKRDAPIPNIEFKFPKVDPDDWVLANGKQVVLNGKTIKISPIELQIPYKLYLGSEKDIEDGRYLYRLFKEKIDNNLLKYFLEKLDKQDEFNRYIA